MTHQAHLLHFIEDLLQKRLEVLKSYPVLSVEALHCLEKEDVQGFTQKLEERDALARKVDTLNAQLNETIAKLDEDKRSFIAQLTSSGMSGTIEQNRPEWGESIARSMERTQKVLHNCVHFDARLNDCAQSLKSTLQKQLEHAQAQRKINATYLKQGAVLTDDRLR